MDLGEYGKGFGEFGKELGTTIIRHKAQAISIGTFVIVVVVILCCCMISLSVVSGLGYLLGHDVGIKKICNEDGTANAAKCPQPKPTSTTDGFKSVTSYKKESKQTKTGQLPSYRSIYKF